MTPSWSNKGKIGTFGGTIRSRSSLFAEVGPWWPVAILVPQEENTSEGEANMEKQSRELMKEHLNG